MVVNWLKRSLLQPLPVSAVDDDARRVIRRAGQVHVLPVVLVLVGDVVPGAGAAGEDAGQLPVVENRRRDALRSSRLPIGQIPDEVRLDDVALQALVLHQSLNDRLILANGERPVGAVLQAQRHARGAVVAEAERVVAAERHAVAEAPVRRELHRVVGAVERLPLLIDVRVAADRAQQLLHVGARAGDTRTAALRVGSWFCGRNAEPRSIALMFTAVSDWNAFSTWKERCPT